MTGKGSGAGFSPMTDTSLMNGAKKIHLDFFQSMLQFYYWRERGILVSVDAGVTISVDIGNGGTRTKIVAAIK